MKLDPIVRKLLRTHPRLMRRAMATLYAGAERVKVRGIWLSKRKQP